MAVNTACMGGAVITRFGESGIGGRPEGSPPDAIGATLGRHLHIGGTSRLGLGLIVPAMASAGLRTTLFIRPGERTRQTSKWVGRCLASARMFRLRTPAQCATFDLDHVAEIYGERGEVSAAFLDEASCGDVGILTTSVGDALTDERLPLAIARVLATRRRNRVASVLSISACENSRSSLWLERRVRAALTALGETLQQEAMAQAVFVPLVVDRCCTKVEVAADGVVDVHASDHANLWLECSLPGWLARRLHCAGTVETEVLTQVDRVWCTKLWAVNGFHLAVALAADRAGFASLRAFAGSRNGARQVAQIGDEIADLLSVVLPEHDGDARAMLLRRAADRLVQVDDEVARVLSRRNTDEGAYRRDLFIKIGLPLRLYRAKGGRVANLRWLAIASVGHDRRTRDWGRDFELSLRGSLAGVATRC